MKASEFILEDFDRYKLHNLSSPSDQEVTSVTDLNKLVDIIASNCSTMLKAYQQTGKYLFRGMNSRDKVIITGIRPDRRPVEMDRSVHDALHASFQRIGLKATRTNSIFCSTNLRVASDWGSEVYVVFVKDGWSGTIFKDIIEDYSFHVLQLIGSDYDHDPNETDRRIKQLNPISFSTSAELAKILNKNYSDIIITGDSYIAVQYGTSLFTKLTDLLKI